MPTRLVAVNRYFSPDDSATSRLLADLANAMTTQGHSVRVITSRRVLENPDVLLNHKEWIGGVEVHRVWSTNLGRRNLWGRAADYLTFYALLVLKLVVSTRRGDILVAMTDPPLLGVVAGLVARLRGAKVINWLQDVYPEVAGSLGMLRRDSWLYRSLLTVRNGSLRGAAANVVLGDRMSETILAAEPGARRVTLIPNWFEEISSAGATAATNRYRVQLGLGERFIVGYAGNFGRAHVFDNLVKAGQKLRDGSHVHFLMIGGGAQFETLQKQVAYLGLQNWSFLPYQPRERAAEFLSAIDVHFICLDPRVEGLIVPSKLYGILAAGRPSIFEGDTDSEVARVLRRHRCGYSATDAAQLTELIQRMAADAGLRKTLGWNARAAYEKEYARMASLDSWKALVSELARTP